MLADKIKETLNRVTDLKEKDFFFKLTNPHKDQQS